MMEIFNFAGIITTFILGLAGGCWVLRRAGYAWGKTLFGTLALTVGGLAVAAILGTIGRRLGLEMLPLPWVAVAGMIYALRRISLAQGDGGSVGTDHQHGL